MRRALEKLEQRQISQQQHSQLSCDRSPTIDPCVNHVSPSDSSSTTMSKFRYQELLFFLFLILFELKIEQWVGRCSVLQCVTVCCSVLQCGAVCCSVLQCVSVQCAAVCRSVLQCVAVCCFGLVAV